MLKHGILGLLNYGDMTGYDIMRVFKDSLSFFWTAQTSQIYRELQALKSNGWATDENVLQEGKPDKKLFSITESGKEELNRWLLDEDTGFETKSPLLMKTFFRGERSIDENIAFFKNVQKECAGIISDNQIPEKNISMYEKKMQNRERALYWKMTMEYGIMYMKMLNEWTDKCISELEDLKNENIND